MRICEVINCGNVVWGTDKKTRTGYCKNHQHLRTDISKESIIQKAIKKQRQSSAKRTGSKLRSLAGSSVGNQEMIEENMGDKVMQAQMDLFWKTAARELSENPYCMECGAFIPEKIKQIGKKFTLDGYRCATAHVLPKKREYGFPSVAANLNNRLFLGAGCGCHSRYDRSWEDAATMKVFPLAIEKIKLFFHLIDKKELKNMPEVIRQYLYE